MGISLLVSTYNAGKLIALRADDEGRVLNTHFRDFRRPMGLAVAGNRLAIGTRCEIWEYLNLPAVAADLPPAGRHDACYLARGAHVTGDVHIHEMAWGRASPAGGNHDLHGVAELWFINTTFSCLCTRGNGAYSFVPRWRPRFVSALAPEDRCHLNGLGMVDGVPRYVTALGETDTPAGWRGNKRDGGLLIDVASNEVLARGLSMPHSPRWHDGRLWVLDSGSGRIGIVDRARGGFETVAELPGFTRGLTFHGHLAFVGLSQVRETAVFSGLRITDRPLAERHCGVWVVDLRTGRTVAFVKFEGSVQEVFAVEVLPGIRYPDLINDDEELLASSYVLPDEALDDVPTSLRASGHRPARANCDA